MNRSRAARAVGPPAVCVCVHWRNNCHGGSGNFESLRIGCRRCLALVPSPCEMPSSHTGDSSAEFVRTSSAGDSVGRSSSSSESGLGYTGARWHARSLKAHQIFAFPRRIGLGSESFHKFTNNWPPGPSTPGEFAQWPKTITSAILTDNRVPFGNERRSRLESLLENGVVVHTDFSGKHSPEATLLMLEHSLRERGVELPRPLFRFWRYSDKDAACLHAVMASERPPEHVYADIAERLPPEAAAFVKERADTRKRKKGDASLVDGYTRFREVNKLLKQHRRQFYSWSSSSRACLRHPGQDCCHASNAPFVGGGAGRIRSALRGPCVRHGPATANEWVWPTPQVLLGALGLSKFPLSGSTLFSSKTRTSFLCRSSKSRWATGTR